MPKTEPQPRTLVAAAPTASELLPPRASQRALDPRTKILLLLLCSLTAMSPTGLRFVPAICLLAVGLAVWERASARAAALTGAAVVCGICGWLLPAAWPNSLTATVGITAAYFVRFVAVAGIGAHLVATTSPTALCAGLHAWHAPRALAVTVAVMLRFFPLVTAEARAVLDAMRLRGLAGVRGLLRHPVRAVERFTVPIIAASLRASEDLSASAILRGLGSHHRPTAMYPPRFGAPDAVLLLVVGALGAATVAFPALLAAWGIDSVATMLGAAA